MFIKRINNNNYGKNDINIIADFGVIVMQPVGALPQCKGLMEIVAATTPHHRGMVSTFAFVSRMLPTAISTVLTGPMFRLSGGGRTT